MTTINNVRHQRAGLLTRSHSSNFFFVAKDTVQMVSNIKHRSPCKFININYPHLPSMKRSELFFVNKNNLGVFPGINETHDVNCQTQKITIQWVHILLFKTFGNHLNPKQRQGSSTINHHFLSCAMLGAEKPRQRANGWFNGLPFLQTPQEKRPCFFLVVFSVCYLSNTYLKFIALW